MSRARPLLVPAAPGLAPVRIRVDEALFEARPEDTIATALIAATPLHTAMAQAPHTPRLEPATYTQCRHRPFRKRSHPPALSQRGCISRRPSRRSEVFQGSCHHGYWLGMSWETLDRKSVV